MRIGARKSELARRQAETVARRLERARPGLDVECVWVVTEGDRVLDRPLPEIGGKGLFTARLEADLASGRIDAAVHSLKDLPTRLAPAFRLASVPEREDPRDILLGPEGPVRLEDLPEGSTVGTSSVRRRAQLLARRPDCRTRSVRGNVDTRIRKMREGQVDALLLAAAGLIRLGLVETDGATFLEPPSWLPAPAQGALGVETRSDDGRTVELLSSLEDGDVRAAVDAERSLLARLEGGCLVPVGALARSDGNGGLRLDAVVLDADGTRELRASGRASIADARTLGESVARELLDRGAGPILAAAAS